MKYAQLVTGLLIGTALGSSVVAATGDNTGAVDAAAVKKIVRETILQEPQLIIESVQKFQQTQHEQDTKNASTALKDKAIHDQVFDNTTAGTVGPKDSKRIIVEFFDYNCPACKLQYKAFSEVLAKDPSIHVIFREFPIFGPVSENNARLGLAVARLAPEKYFPFYQKMMSVQGHAEEKDTLGFIKDLGLDVEKVKAESQKPEVAKIIADNHTLGEKLHIEGTPTVIVGDELVPHAVSPDDLMQKLGAISK